jgi:hypothetical protein
MAESSATWLPTRPKGAMAHEPIIHPVYPANTVMALLVPVFHLPGFGPRFSHFQWVK